MKLIEYVSASVKSSFITPDMPSAFFFVIEPTALSPAGLLILNGKSMQSSRQPPKQQPPPRILAQGVPPSSFLLSYTSTVGMQQPPQNGTTAYPRTGFLLTSIGLSWGPSNHEQQVPRAPTQSHVSPPGRGPMSPSTRVISRAQHVQQTQHPHLVGATIVRSACSAPGL